jgi:hypothetical protein
VYKTAYKNARKGQKSPRKQKKQAFRKEKGKMKTTIKSIAVALAFCAAAFLTVSAIIESTAPDGSEKYIMRDYNGRIAVFVYGEEEPQEVFDVFTSSLPRGEAERVYKGITVEGDEALQKLIEDFTG